MTDTQRVLYLHVGLPKTGTSALQVFFARNVDLLLKNGCRYPGASEKVGTEELITSGNAVKIAREAYLESDSDTTGVTTGLVSAMMAGDKDILLSSEFFSEWDQRRHECLKSLVDAQNYKLKVIAYLRDQADVVVTHYFQRLKRSADLVDHRVVGFKRFAAYYLNVNHYLHFDRFLSMLSAVYGRENVRCKSTKKSELLEQNLFVDMLDALGISGIEKFDMEISSVNPTPTQREMYIRAMIGLFAPSIKFSDNYLKVVGKMHAAFGNQKGDVNYFIDTEVVDSIRNDFLEANQAVCDQWLGGKSYAETFDQNQYAKKEEPGYENMDIGTLTASFGGLFVEYANKVEKLESQVEKLISRLQD